MLAEDDLKHIELYAALNVDVLRVAGAESLRREGCIFDLRNTATNSAELREVRLFQELGPIDDIRYVKIDDVVACDDVCIDFANKITPGSQHRGLILEAVHFAANDWRAILQSENISDEHFTLPLDLDDVGNLNDWVRLCCREFTSLCRTLNIETEDAQGWKFRVVALTWKSNNIIVVVDIKLNLAVAGFLTLVPYVPVSGPNAHPAHPTKLLIDHES